MITLIIIMAIRKRISDWTSQLRQLKIALQKVLTVILFFNLLTLKSNCQSQYYVFDAMRKGEKIGELHASKTTTGGNTNLRVSTSINTRFIFEVSVETDAQTSFGNNKMSHASYTKKVNGSEKLCNNITQFNNGYIFKNKSGDSIFKNDVITGTSIAMYFNEPLNVTRLFSEMFLCFVPVTCVEPGKYKIEMPDGSVNYYSYSKGILVKVEIHATFFTVSFNLKSISQKPLLTSTK